MKRQWILMSVSALMVCCLFVFMPGNVFAAQTEGSSSYKNATVYLYPSGATSTDTADLYLAWLITSFYAYKNASSGDNLVCFECKLVVRNTTNRDLIIPSTYLRITPNFTFSTTGADIAITEVEYVSGQLLCDRVGTNGSFYFSNAPDNSLFSYILVPANGDISCVFNIHANAEGSSALSNFTITMNTPTVPVTPVVVEPGDAVFTSYNSYLPWIYYRLNTIYDAILDNAQQGSETDTGAGDTQEQIEEIHGTEQTWYQGTETALEGTGLSTFTLGVHEAGAFGAMADFTAVWNSMGSFTIVPIFALSMKVATTVIRHMPRRKRMSEKDD